MDVATLITRLWNLRRAVLAAAVVSIIVATLTAYHVSLVPPSIKQPKLRIAAAQTQILLDSPRSTIGDLSVPVGPLADRAEIYSQFLETEEVRARIASVAGIPTDALDVEGQTDGTAPVPGQDQRAQELLTETPTTRVFFRSQVDSPVISILTQAHDPRTAIGLANGAAKAIGQYVVDLQHRQSIPRADRLQIQQLGAAQGGYVNSGVGKSQVALTGVGVFLVLCVLILAGSKVLVDVRLARRRGDRLDADWAASLGASET